MNSPSPVRITNIIIIRTHNESVKISNMYTLQLLLVYAPGHWFAFSFNAHNVLPWVYSQHESKRPQDTILRMPVPLSPGFNGDGRRSKIPQQLPVNLGPREVRHFPAVLDGRDTLRMGTGEHDIKFL